MAVKKEIRSDGTYYIVKGTSNPKLGARIGADGTEHLFLDYHLGMETYTDEKTGEVKKRKLRKRK